MSPNLIRQFFMSAMFGFCAVFLTQCHPSEKSCAEYRLYIDVDSKADEEISIYDLFSKVELTALDSSYLVSNHVYVGESYIAYDGNLFYILDIRTLAVNAYDREGHLVCHSEKMGRGPGEYTLAEQISYNESENAIEILSPMCKILRYTTDSLRFESMVDFSGGPFRAIHKFGYGKEGYVLFSISEEEQLWQMDRNGDVKSAYGYNLPEHLRHYISVQAPFFTIDGNLCFLRPYDGMIYTFDEAEMAMKPFIEWNLGDCQYREGDIPTDLQVSQTHDFIIRNSRKRVSPFINAKASGKIIFANAIFGGGKTYTLYYDLETDECHFFEKTKEGMKFLSELFYGERMYKFIDYKYLPEYINRDILDEASKAAYDRVMEETGCAIATYYLK